MRQNLGEAIPASPWGRLSAWSVNIRLRNSDCPKSRGRYSATMGEPGRLPRWAAFQSFGIRSCQNAAQRAHLCLPEGGRRQPAEIELTPVRPPYEPDPARTGVGTDEW